MTFETFNKKHALRLIREGATVKRTQTRGECTYWTLSMPAKWFKWPRAPRAISPEQREALRNRIPAGFARKNSAPEPKTPSETP